MYICDLRGIKTLRKVEQIYRKSSYNVMTTTTNKTKANKGMDDGEKSRIQ